MKFVNNIAVASAMVLGVATSGMAGELTVYTAVEAEDLTGR